MRPDTCKNTGRADPWRTGARICRTPRARRSVPRPESGCIRWSRRSAGGIRDRPRERSRPYRWAPPPTSRNGSDNSFHQIIHAFEVGIPLAAIGAGGDNGFALVVGNRSLEDGVIARNQFGLDVVGVLARLGRYRFAIRRALGDSFF